MDVVQGPQLPFGEIAPAGGVVLDAVAAALLEGDEPAGGARLRKLYPRADDVPRSGRPAPLGALALPLPGPLAPVVEGIEAQECEQALPASVLETGRGCSMHGLANLITAPSSNST